MVSERKSRSLDFESNLLLRNLLKMTVILSNLLKMTHLPVIYRSSKAFDDETRWRQLWIRSFSTIARESKDLLVVMEMPSSSLSYPFVSGHIVLPCAICYKECGSKKRTGWSDELHSSIHHHNSNAIQSHHNPLPFELHFPAGSKHYVRECKSSSNLAMGSCRNISSPINNFSETYSKLP